MSRGKSTDTYSTRVRPQYNQNEMGKGLKIPSGIYRGIVVDTFDPAREGRIKVQIMKFYGTFPPGQDSATNLDADLYLGAMWCRQVMPFGGTTPPAPGPNGVVSQNSYGISGQPPGLNNEVIVAFGGDMHSGIVLGVVLDPGRRDGLNGAGATRVTASGATTIGQEVARTATSPNELPDEHPQAEALRTQGLDKDRIRGLNFSTPTRDPSPRTMGMTTPAGHSLTMDDGDIEDADNLGIRLRTAGGAQILMDDTNGLTYINNREGNVWIEMNRNGDIDIYAASTINMHTRGDFNFHAGGSFNLQANGDINMKALGGVRMQSVGGSYDISAGGNLNLTADGNGNLSVAGSYRETAARIDMNGAAAASATPPPTNQLAGNTNVTESVARRVPEAEPWAGHLDVSNLDAGSAEAAADQQGSESYYYGAPSDVSSYNDQTGEFDLNNYPEATGGGAFLQWAPGKDKRVDPNLISMVEEVARRFGRPLTIISGRRSPSHNAAVGGAKGSMHMQGKALDISGSGLTNQDRLDLIAIASAVGIKGIGVYNGGSLHFDNRSSAPAGWGSDYTSASIPSYALNTMNKHRSGGFG
jgi:hypothetical protein